MIGDTLTHIMNCSIQSVMFFEDWKREGVTPLYKAGEEFLLNNYRPVSVLPIISKIMKGIFTSVFMNILHDAISSMKNSQGLHLSIHAELHSTVLLKSGCVTLTMVS